MYTYIHISYRIGRLRFHHDNEYENEIFVRRNNHFLCYSWAPIRYRCS